MARDKINAFRILQIIINHHRAWPGYSILPVVIPHSAGRNAFFLPCLGRGWCPWEQSQPPCDSRVRLSTLDRTAGGMGSPLIQLHTECQATRTQQSRCNHGDRLFATPRWKQYALGSNQKRGKAIGMSIVIVIIIIITTLVYIYVCVCVRKKQRLRGLELRLLSKPNSQKLCTGCNLNDPYPTRAGRKERDRASSRSDSRLEQTRLDHHWSVIWW